MTFRMAATTGDVQQYRSKEELAAIREKCPIERLKRELAKRGVKMEELQSLVSAPRHEVQQAVDAARCAPP